MPTYVLHYTPSGGNRIEAAEHAVMNRAGIPMLVLIDDQEREVFAIPMNRIAS